MNSAAATSLTVVSSTSTRYTQIKTHYDEQYRTAWCYMAPQPRACFNTALLGELNSWCEELHAGTGLLAGKEVRYHVLASDTPGVYNFGGDLELFRRFVINQDREGLLNYARTCIDAIHANISNFHRDITTISLVQGDALGGGFETALSSDVLIAEKGTKMGLPEILFNLFPGMGAYSILSRRLDAVRAEKLILSGRIYSAEELHEMGLVDILAEELQGEMAVYDYIRRENRSANGIKALRQVKNRLNPISHGELMDVAAIWADAAMRLQHKDLRMMERLVSRQSGIARQRIAG